MPIWLAEKHASNAGELESGELECLKHSGAERVSPHFLHKRRFRSMRTCSIPQPLNIECLKHSTYPMPIAESGRKS
jgi:hypothetical protein